MPTLGAYSMHIRCNDRRLEEHGVQVDGQTATCWVESKVGQTFVIVMKNDKSSVDVLVSVNIDGARVKKKLIGRNGQTHCEGLRVDKDSMKPFVFTNLELSDDDALLHTLESQYTESIGSIVLTLQEVELERGRPRPDRLRGPDRSITNKLIHERAKKMGGHTVGLSDNVLRRPSRGRAPPSRLLDPLRPGPVATFIFKYRSRDLLVAQGVIDSRRQQEAIPNARAHPGANNAPKRPRSPVVQSATAVKPEPISLEDDDDEISQLELQQAQISQRLAEARKRRRVNPLVKQEARNESGLSALGSDSLIVGEDGIIDLTQE